MNLMDFPLNFLRSINMSIAAFNLQIDVSKMWILVSDRISSPMIVICVYNETRDHSRIRSPN